MSVGWLSALKVIPWADVIEATPLLVKGARKLFQRSQDEADQVADTPAALPQTLPEALQRLQQLEDELQQLSRSQADSAALLQSLAEQNARLVATVEQLHQRSQWMLGAGVVVTLALVALLVWVVFALPR